MTTATEYWIATDLNGIAIQAIGHSEEEAIATMIADAGPFRNAEGDEIHGDEARAQCVAMRCTKKLYDQVMAEGGMISWSVKDGIAYTDEELAD